eukprot:gene29756-5173_t
MLSTAASSGVCLNSRGSVFRTGAPPRVAARAPVQTSLAGDMSLSSVGRVSFGHIQLPTVSSGTATRKVTTMASKVTGKIKLALTAGKANPSPPVGPALGAKGVNIMAFCKEYNAQTQKNAGQIIPVEITVYEDRSFTFVLKTSPASVLLKKAAGLASGSTKASAEIVGSVTRAQLEEIATIKMPDTNATKIESVMKMVEGTARNMGIKVVG